MPLIPKVSPQLTRNAGLANEKASRVDINRSVVLRRIRMPVMSERNFMGEWMRTKSSMRGSCLSKLYLKSSLIRKTTLSKSLGSDVKLYVPFRLMFHWLMLQWIYMNTRVKAVNQTTVNTRTWLILKSRRFSLQVRNKNKFLLLFHKLVNERQWTWTTLCSTWSQTQVKKQTVCSSLTFDQNSLPLALKVKSQVESETNTLLTQPSNSLPLELQEN